MKTLGISFALMLVVALFAAGACSKPDAARIAVVDHKTIFEEYVKGHAAYAELREHQAAAQAAIDTLVQGVQNAKDDYEQVKATATEHEREALHSELLARVDAYQEEFRKVEESLETEDQALLARLNGEIDYAVAEVARAEGYDLVLDSEGQSVNEALFQGEALHVTSLTDAVIERLNGGR